MKSAAITLGLLTLLALAGCDLFEDKRVTAAKERVARSLKDPDSAKFRDVVLHDKGVCGEVNGKGSAGGYVGFSRFIVTNSGVYWLEQDPPVYYAPKETLVSGGILIRILDAKIAAMRAWTGPPPAPSDSEFESRALRAVFGREWAEVCEGR